MVVAAAGPATVASSRAVRTIVACFTAGLYPWPRASRKDIFWIDAGSRARVARSTEGRVMPRFARHLWPLASAWLVVVLATPGGPAPLDSNLASATLGGGCSPTGITPGILDMLVLINPEWAPVTDPQAIDEAPRALHGTVDDMHGETSGDFPSTHLHSDVVIDVDLDPVDRDLSATGNDEPGLIAFEWEAGVYPDWAWPGQGDRIVGLGRFIFDCGHPGAHPGRCSATTARQCVLDGDCRPPACPTCGALETCVGTVFGYSSELHPPHATAVIRRGRGGLLQFGRKARAVPVTKADVYVSPEGGGAGDRCVVTHHASELDQLGIECFPLAQQLAQINKQDFVFDLPLPPRPAGGRARWQVVDRPAPGGVAARSRIRRRLRGTNPHLEVRILMSRRVRGQLPTGFAGTFVAGWDQGSKAMTHVRMTLTGVVIKNALKPSQPVVPRTCSTSTATACATDADCPAGESCFGLGNVPGWVMQVAMNGEWRQLPGLAGVQGPTVVPYDLVLDQYLPPDGTLRLQADGFSRECIDAMYGTSLAFGLQQLGLVKGLQCLASTAHRPGSIDVP